MLFVLSVLLLQHCVQHTFNLVRAPAILVRQGRVRGWRAQCADFKT